MAESRRMILDDEMSRFEAEISGPSPLDLESGSRGAHSKLDHRPIIGVNTFDKVKHQLQRASPDVPPPLQPLPRPDQSRPVNQLGPSFTQTEQEHGPNRPIGHGPNRPIGHGPNRPIEHSPNRPIGHGPNRPIEHGPNRPIEHSPNRPIEHGPNRPIEHGPNRPIEHGPNRPIGQHGPIGPMSPRMGPPGPHQGGPRQPGFGPRAPSEFEGQKGHFGPMHRPGPPGLRPGPFMGPNRGPRGMGSLSFAPRPHPPPGFVPPQLNRGHHMGGPPRMGGGRPPHPENLSSILRPPPPPPNLLGANSLRSPTSSAVISSAPKMYVAPPVAPLKGAESKLPVVLAPLSVIAKAPPPPPGPIPSENKKRKKDKDKSGQLEAKKKAVEMAEKVRETTIREFAPRGSRAHLMGVPIDNRRRKKNLRYAGGQVWEDPNLAEWENDDFRLFAGDLGNDVTDELLQRYFSHYASFAKAKVVRDKRTNKSKGYGFISFSDSQDYIRAMKEMNGKYLGSRPIKLRKSVWKDRNFDVVQRKTKEKVLLGLK